MKRRSRRPHTSLYTSHWRCTRRGNDQALHTCWCTSSRSGTKVRSRRPGNRSRMSSRSGNGADSHHWHRTWWCPNHAPRRSSRMSVPDRRCTPTRTTDNHCRPDRRRSLLRPLRRRPSQCRPRRAARSQRIGASSWSPKIPQLDEPLHLVTRCPCHRDVWIGWPLLYDWCPACSTVARPGVAPDLPA